MWTQYLNNYTSKCWLELLITLLYGDEVVGYVCSSADAWTSQLGSEEVV